MQPGIVISIGRLMIIGLAVATAASLPAGSRAAAAQSSSTPDSAAVERGRIALTQHSYLKAEWSIEAYRGAWKLWNTSAPDPIKDPDGYARAFARHYGLHPAPYPNDGLPMGLRWSRKADGTKTGIQVDCMACHGGSIGGKSYVGLPNTQVDYELLFTDLFRADGRRVPLLPFTISSARGTTNAGMMAVVLLSLRNPDLSRRRFPLPMGANLPELDAPRGGTSSTRRRCTMTAAPRPPPSGPTCSFSWVRRPLSNSRSLSRRSGISRLIS